VKLARANESHLIQAGFDSFAPIFGQCVVDDFLLSFNPRPAVRPGDARILKDSGFAIEWFQSAPGREAGRCALCDRKQHQRYGVSIRARP